MEQGTDQRCLAAGSGAEDHNHQIASLQLLSDPIAFVLKAAAADVVLDPFDQTIDVAEAGRSGIPAVLWSGGGLTLALGRACFQASPHRPTHLHRHGGQQHEPQQQHRREQPGR